MAKLDDEALVDAFIASGRDAYSTDRVSVRNRHIAKGTKLWKRLDERGEAVRPRLLSYLSSADPAERFGACVYTFSFAPEESFKVWEELIRSDYGDVSDWAYIHLQVLRREGRAPGGLEELEEWRAPVREVHKARWIAQDLERRQLAEATTTSHPLGKGDVEMDEPLSSLPALRRLTSDDGWRNDAASWSFIKGEQGAFLLIDLYADGSTNAECVVLEFRDCQHIKIGEYDPWQDELIAAHDGDIYDGTGWIGEFTASQWATEVHRTDLRHFVVPFNSGAFQCLARDCFESRTVHPMKDELVEIAKQLKRRDN